MEFKITSQYRPNELRPSSKKTSPKEENAQSAPLRDTYEPSGLVLKGEIPDAGQLKIAQVERKDSVDWGWVETRMSTSVTTDNADSLIRQVDSVAATYVATKSHLEQVYAGDEEKLSKHMSRLDTLFLQAKQRLSSSYQSSVGTYYEGLGHSGIKQEMGDSLLASIDRKLEEMEHTLQEPGLYEKAGGDSYRLVELSLDVRSLKEQEEGTPSAATREKGDESYSLYELQAAGTVAKLASALTPDRLPLMSEEELGLHLAGKSLAQIIEENRRPFLEDNLRIYAGSTYA